MTKKIIWRLKETPTSEHLRELVKDGILSKDEAREILFSEVEPSERSVESLKEEIKFLRDLVMKLSHSNNTTIIETIREVQKPYIRWEWWHPYQYWCGDVPVVSCGTLNIDATTQSFGGCSTYTSSNFNDIQTF